jgi:hypothetical protein
MPSWRHSIWRDGKFWVLSLQPLVGLSSLARNARNRCVVAIATLKENHCLVRVKRRRKENHCPVRVKRRRKEITLAEITTEGNERVELFCRFYAFGNRDHIQIMR